jgi:hypothetical protein
MFSGSIWYGILQLLLAIAAVLFGFIVVFQIDISHNLERLISRPLDLTALLISFFLLFYSIYLVGRRLGNTASSADSPRDFPGEERESYDNQDMLSPLLIARLRLTNHIKTLRNNAVTNLFIGIGIAALGVMILFWAVLQVGSMQFDETHSVDTYRVVALIIFPKLSITIFIQIFSYFFLAMYRSNFFLAMYRSNQQEIRYFQNEITFIDSFAAALIGAIRTPAPANLKIILTALSKNERNRLMKKGEKTIIQSDEVEFIRALSTLSKLKDTFGASEREA